MNTSQQINAREAFINRGFPIFRSQNALLDLLFLGRPVAHSYKIVNSHDKRSAITIHEFTYEGAKISIAENSSSKYSFVLSLTVTTNELAPLFNVRTGKTSKGDVQELFGEPGITFGHPQDWRYVSGQGAGRHVDISFDDHDLVKKLNWVFVVND